jgi:DNA invertase Pin-like site-specific DNA recombinase
LLKAVARREVDMVAAWSVDRLGRSLQGLVEVLSDLHSKGIDLYLHQQGLDTSTPSGRAMFQMMGVFAEFERAMIRERVLSGLARAKAEGVQLGRRRLEETDAKKVAAIRQSRAKGKGWDSWRSCTVPPVSSCNRRSRASRSAPAASIACFTPATISTRRATYSWRRLSTGRRSG